MLNSDRACFKQPMYSGIAGSPVSIRILLSPVPTRYVLVPCRVIRKPPAARPAPSFEGWGLKARKGPERGPPSRRAGVGGSDIPGRVPLLRFPEQPPAAAPGCGCRCCCCCPSCSPPCRPRSSPRSRF